jgi:hypothetical protein
MPRRSIGRNFDGGICKINDGDRAALTSMASIGAAQRLQALEELTGSQLQSL